MGDKPQDHKKAIAKPDPTEEKLSDFLPPELVSQIPPSVQQQITSSVMFQGSLGNPIARKIDSAHITKAMELAGDTANKNFEFAKGTRRYQFAVFLIAIAVFIFLVLFLVEKPTILSPMLTAILGFAGGYGIGRKVG